MTLHTPHRDPNARTMAAYRAARAKWADEILADEADPADWQQFREQLAQLGRGATPAQFLAWLAASFLPRAHPDVRAIALRMIAQRADRIRIERGDQPLDDPAPPQTSVFIEARRLLQADGRLR